MRRNFAFLNNLGAMVEYYDYVLFALCLGYIQRTFFPPEGELHSLFGALLAFQVGAWSRLLFGHIFSISLRRSSLPSAMTLGALVMGIATFGIALLPCYQTLGLLSALLLLALRFIQGAAFALEVPNTLSFGAQNVPLASHGLFTSLNISSITLGSILAHISVLFCPEELMARQMWRLLFALGGCGGIAVFFVRRRFVGGLVDCSFDATPEDSLVPGGTPSFLKSFFAPLAGIGLSDVIVFARRTCIFLLPAFMITGAMCFPVLFKRMYETPYGTSFLACLCGLCTAAICAPMFGLFLSRKQGKLSPYEMFLLHALLCGTLWLGVFALHSSWICTFCVLYQIALCGLLVISYSLLLKGVKRESLTLPYNLAFALSASALSYLFSSISIIVLAAIISVLVIFSTFLLISN